MSMSRQRKREGQQLVRELLERATEATPFSQLTYLLRLVTSLNFDENLRSSFKRKYASALDESDPGFTLLDSIAAILVQEHEIVATCYTSDTVSVIAARTDSNAIPPTDVDVDVFVPSDTFKFQSIQLAALSNPQFSDILNSNRNLHKVQIKTEGENLWKKVQGTPRGWYCAFMGPRPLKDHVTTVSAYLDDYKSQTDRDKQGSDSVKFTNYLISTCWPKMVRRITSWQAIGFIFLTKNISTEQLYTFGRNWNRFSSGDGPGDRTLAIFLGSLKDRLKRSLLLASDREINDKTLNYTEDDFPVMFSPNCQALIFSKETTREFHKLTMAAFDGFAFTFIRLRKESDKLSESERTPLLAADSESGNLTARQAKVFHLLKMASNHYRFLLAIICSNSFEVYFEMIKETQGQNVLPVREQRDLYAEYLRKFQSNIAKDSDVKQIGDAEVEAGELEDAEVEADELEDAEVEVDELDDDGSSKVEDHKASLSFLLRFVKTFVVHLTAKRALERYCFMGRNHEVKISLFAVERSPLSIPAGSWPNMQAILRESFSSDPSQSSTSAGDSNIAVIKAIKLLEDKIQTPPEKCSTQCRKILENFKRIIQKTPVLLPGGLHCETVLATLGKYFEDTPILWDSDDNANTDLKLIQSGMISVSKLCCPVCWELLALLGDEKPLSLRGGHSTIYPVELPSWLSSEIVDKMNKRFQGYLREEIEIMLNGAEQPDSGQVTRRNRHVSHESESNISIASSTNSTNDLEDNE